MRFKAYVLGGLLVALCAFCSYLYFYAEKGPEHLIDLVVIFFADLVAVLIFYFLFDFDAERSALLESVQARNERKSITLLTARHAVTEIEGVIFSMQNTSRGTEIPINRLNELSMGFAWDFDRAPEILDKLQELRTEVNRWNQDPARGVGLWNSYHGPLLRLCESIRVLLEEVGASKGKAKR